MEFAEVVHKRRMVRSFSAEPIAPEVVDRLLELATRAPSAGFTQGWAFVVLEGDQTERFWSLTVDPEWRARTRRQGLFRAPVVILPLCSQQAYLDRYAQPDKLALGREVPESWPVPYWVVDSAFASMLMLLGAVDEGLGAAFLGIWRGERELMEALGVPSDYRPIGALALGWPDPDDPPSPSLDRGRRSLEELAHRGHWRG